MKLKFYRNATFVLTLDNIKILVDPMYMQKGKVFPVPSTLNLCRNPLYNFPEDYPEISNDDILLITHHHFDHFDKMAARMLPKLIATVSPSNGVARLRRMGFRNIFPLLPDQEIKINNLKIGAFPVKHTQRLSKMLYKPGLGYWIQFLNKSIYISGDTICFEKLLDRLEICYFDLVILYGGGARIPILGKHTLSHKEIISIIQKLNPRKSVIMHLDSLNHCKENRTDLLKLIEISNLNNNVIVPLPGEEYVFDTKLE